MGIRRTGILSLLALLALPAMAAENINGKWLATVDAGGQSIELAFNLKAEGEKLTGDLDLMGNATPITDGTVKGEDVAFKLTIDAGGTPLLLTYKGKIKGDTLTMVSTFTMEGAPPNETEVVAKRAK